MKTQASLFSRFCFILTLAFHITTCVIFCTLLLTMDSFGIFLPRNVFSSLLYWVLAVSSTACYIYIYGFPKTQNAEGRENRKKNHSLFYAFSMPLFIGYGIAVMVYYMLYALSALFMTTVGYVVVLLLIASLFYTTWFLINLYFNLGKRLNSVLRKSVISVSLVVSSGLFILSLCTLLIRA
jgi:hypothetical protein